MVGAPAVISSITYDRRFLPGCSANIAPFVVGRRFKRAFVRDVGHTIAQAPELRPFQSITAATALARALAVALAMVQAIAQAISQDMGRVGNLSRLAPVTGIPGWSTRHTEGSP